MLEARHITARNAFENIGKNFPELRRGNEPDFDSFLNWANAAELRHRRSAFDYLLAGVSLIARPVATMPELNRPRLTFVRVAGFLQSMLEVPSGGVHHQFIVTACLHAIIEEFGLGGPGGLRVETKNVAVSDASAGTAADIQIMRGGRTEEALEVTANPSQSKITAATRAARAADLARAHIVANAPPSEFTRIAESDLSSIDLSVLDVSAFVRTMVAIMKKPAREAALVRLYELLEQAPARYRTSERLRHAAAEARVGRAVLVIAEKIASPKIAASLGGTALPTCSYCELRAPENFTPFGNDCKLAHSATVRRRAPINSPIRGVPPRIK